MARPPSHAVFRRPAVVLERLRELASRISPAWLDAVRAAVADAAQSGEQLRTLPQLPLLPQLPMQAPPPPQLLLLSLLLPLQLLVRPSTALWSMGQSCMAQGGGLGHRHRQQRC